MQQHAQTSQVVNCVAESCRPAEGTMSAESECDVFAVCLQCKRWTESTLHLRPVQTFHLPSVNCGCGP